MSGNAYEWCNDWYGAYISTAQIDPKGPATGSSRIRRGGYWNCTADALCTAGRSKDSPRIRDGDIGLRLYKAVP